MYAKRVLAQGFRQDSMEVLLSPGVYYQPLHVTVLSEESI